MQETIRARSASLSVVDIKSLRFQDLKAPLTSPVEDTATIYMRKRL